MAVKSVLGLEWVIKGVRIERVETKGPFTEQTPSSPAADGRELRAMGEVADGKRKREAGGPSTGDRCRVSEKPRSRGRGTRFGGEPWILTVFPNFGFS